MKIAILHRDKEVQKKINDWLYLEYDVAGNEEYLVNELLTDLICESGVIALENFLGRWFDGIILIDRNLRFTEIHLTAQEVEAARLKAEAKMNNLKKIDIQIIERNKP